VIGKSVWKRGILIIGLLTAAAIFYVMSQIQDPSRESTGTLVFSNQFMPGIEPESTAQSAASDPIQAPIESADASKLGDLEAIATIAMTSSSEPGSDALSTSLLVAAEPEPFASVVRSPGFDTYRLMREQNRSRQIEAIQGMLQADRLTDGERRELQNQLLQMLSMRELEERAEGLLVARGLSDVIVMLGRSGAEVVVADALEQQDAARIGDVVARLAGVPLDAITIVDGAGL